MKNNGTYNYICTNWRRVQEGRGRCWLFAVLCRVEVNADVENGLLRYLWILISGSFVDKAQKGISARINWGEVTFLLKKEGIERRISLLQMFCCCGNHDLRQMIHLVVLLQIYQVVKNKLIYQTLFGIIIILWFQFPIKNFRR